MDLHKRIQVSFQMDICNLEDISDHFFEDLAISIFLMRKISLTLQKLRVGMLSSLRLVDARPECAQYKCMEYPNFYRLL
ncbi:hypothetical protein MXB_4182 [Myxobolus squamalis]|nr:hypothetical protein MXB_4182 [Myxobolus squamalis]